MSVPRLIARQRRGFALALAAVAMAQAGFATIFSAEIARMAGQGVSAAAGTIFPAVALAMAIGATMLIERWIAERFAQSFILECRKRIFDAVIRNRGGGRESRWLTALVGDLTALRNYAVRGSVKLWTSLLSGTAAGAWFVVSSPDRVIAILPMVVGLGLVIVSLLPLGGRIAAQRASRGRVNRFLIRRVRIEMTAAPCLRGHGVKRLDQLSADLRARIEARALMFGIMEFAAICSGGMATVLLVTTRSGASSSAELVGQISLIGFISGRLLETTRALHARTGGRVALDRLARLLASVPAAAV